jgi:hypothetical protein
LPFFWVFRCFSQSELVVLAQLLDRGQVLYYTYLYYTYLYYTYLYYTYLVGCQELCQASRHNRPTWMQYRGMATGVRGGST